MSDPMKLIIYVSFKSKWPAVEELFTAGSAIVTRCRGTPAEALSYCRRVSPCVLLVDETLFQQVDPDVFSDAVEMGRAIRVLVASEEDDDLRAEHLIRMGCAGILNKKMSAEEILHALDRVTAGELWLSRKRTSSIIQKLLMEAKHHLTLRESQVLSLLSAGFKNSEIAQRLYLSPETIRWHLRTLYKKLGTHDRFRLGIQARLLQESARLLSEPHAESAENFTANTK